MIFRNKRLNIVGQCRARSGMTLFFNVVCENVLLIFTKYWIVTKLKITFLLSCCVILMMCSSTRSKSNFSRGSSVEDTWHYHCAFPFATVSGVSTNFHIDYPFCRQTFSTVPMTSVRLLPSEIVRESLLRCTWQLMESRNLKSVIKNFPLKLYPF
jgi:hypothetical protein